MFGVLTLLAVSLALVALAGMNLWKCTTQRVSSAYGHAYHRTETPIAFWVSASCSVLALLVGAALSLVILIGLIAT